MKRTELERRERDLRKMEKKKITPGEKESMSVGDYIDGLFGLFRYDEEEIFNASDDEDVLEMLENMKGEHPEKQWDVIIRKAVNKTKVAQKDKAYESLRILAGIQPVTT
ncbi:LB_289 family protein [Leptospira sp. 'Mane']|uniref:LB_289 family protein n=1 Tax=Leptospira sp. 'Mane' TaxID=3387407 RepID=UPI00398B5D98